MLTHYLSVALRNFARAPFATAVNLLTLAVGLVCFVTAYAFVKFWDSAERHFPNMDRVHVLTQSVSSRDGNFSSADMPRTPDIVAELLKNDYPDLERIARAVVLDRKLMAASGDRAVRLYGAAVDPEFLEIFELPFVAGSGRSALSEPRTVVITQAIANELFGDEDPLGRTVLIGNSIDTTVTGVVAAIREPSHMGRSSVAQLPFDLLASRDVLEAYRAAGGRPRFFPSGPAANWATGDSITYVVLPGSGPLAAEALTNELAGFAERHMPSEMLRTTDYRFGHVPVTSLLQSSRDFLDTGLSFAGVLLVLGVLVLGVACVNYANLATARAVRRVREIGVRKAFAASPLQIAIQNLLEAALLSIGALVVAIVVFALAQPRIKVLLGAEIGPTFFTSLGVWPFLALLVVAVTLAAGAYPAFVLARVRPATALGAEQARLGSKLFSTLLVGAQFAVASFLLIAVVVIALQNAQVRRSGLGAAADQLVLVENPARMTKVASETLREELARVPQVRGVTEIMYTPWEMLLMTNVSDSPDPSTASRGVVIRQVGYDFFDVFDVPLVAGRVFGREYGEDVPPPPPGPATQPESAAPSNPLSIVVDRAFVEQFGLGTPEEAIDRLVYRPTGPFSAGTSPPLRIVGVVENRSFSFFSGPVGVQAAMYQLGRDLEVTVARVAAIEVDGGIAAIDAVWKRLAPNAAISRRFLDEIFESAFRYWLLVNQLFGLLALMAFSICIAGLFGMATYVAGRRRHEIGVRKTLGATTRQMIALLLVGFGKPVLVANLVAWPLAYLAARGYLNQFSQSIELTPLPFLLSLAITLGIAGVAVLGQTLRAAHATPAQVLRHE